MSEERRIETGCSEVISRHVTVVQRQRFIGKSWTHCFHHGWFLPQQFQRYTLTGNGIDAAQQSVSANVPHIVPTPQ